MRTDHLIYGLKRHAWLYIYPACSCSTWGVIPLPKGHTDPRGFSCFLIPIKMGSKWGKSRDFSTSRGSNSAYLCIDPSSRISADMRSVVCR